MMGRRVWLKSGTECEVLAEHQGRLWLVAVDGSWGPGTIDATATSAAPPSPARFRSADRLGDQVSATWSDGHDRLIFCVRDDHTTTASAGISRSEAIELARYIIGGLT